MDTRDRDRYAPNGTVGAAVNGRITAEQLDYLHGLADELNTTLSGALRRAIDQSQLFDVASGRKRVYDDEGNEQAGAAAFVLSGTPVDELDDEDDES